jgi:hypothetical protein
VDIPIYTFLLIEGIILYTTRFNLISPLCLFSVSIAIYGFAGIYFASQSVFIYRFQEGTIYVGFYYGLAANLAFLMGCALVFIEKSGALHPNRLRDQQLSFLSIPLQLNICLILISIAGAVALMLVSAGSIYSFINSLNMRQISSVGNNWLMFFILAGRLPIHNSLGIAITKNVKFIFLSSLYIAPLIAIIGLVAGRQFILLILLQIYIVYSKYKHISISAKFSSLLVGLLIYFVYGFARFFQGVEGGLGAIDLWIFLSGEDDNQNFNTVMQTTMFDGWYILLSVIEATQYSVPHANGAVLCASFAKVVPGFYDYLLFALYPNYENIVEEYNLKYRAISWISETWLDFGWLGVVLFLAFGYIVMRLYKRMNSPDVGFWETIVLSNIYIYLFIMIRNGLGWAVAYVSIEMLWVILVLGFIKLPLSLAITKTR